MKEASEQDKTTEREHLYRTKRKKEHTKESKTARNTETNN